MSTAVDSHEQGHTDAHGHDDHGHDAHEGHSWPDRKYVMVAIILAIFTAIEVAIPSMDIGRAGTLGLIGLMCIKFVTVVLFFMHLKFDSKIFGYLFWTGLILAIFVYMAALSTFHVFGG